MTQPASRSPNSFLCVIRPAQTGDRKTLKRLVRKFYQSLQPVKAKAWGAIALAGGALLMLALYGFYAHFLALAMLLVLALQADRWTDRTLAPFWVAECRGKVIGCAKLFCYNTHSEAYLVYVDPASRGQGYGSRLVQQLIEEATLPLYLASQPHRMKFYQRLGFVPMASDALPVMIRSRLGVDRYQDYGIVAMVFGQG